MGNRLLSSLLASLVSIALSHGTTYSQSYANPKAHWTLTGTFPSATDASAALASHSTLQNAATGVGEFEYIKSGMWTWLLGLTSEGVNVYCVFQNGLMVIDASDPATPSLLNRTLLPPGSAEDVQVASGHAYLAEGDSGLFILDVSNSDTSILLARVSVPGWTYCVAVHDTVMWLGGSDATLRAYDVTTPANPTLIASVAYPDWIRDIVVVDSLVFVACDDSGLYILSGADPSNPLLVGHYKTSNRLYAVAVVSGLAALGQSSGNFTLIDISDPSIPNARDSLTGLGGITGVTANSSTVYVATGSGLRVIDVSTPANIMLTTTYDVGTAITGVSLADTLAFVGAYNYSFDVLALSDPLNPQMLSRLRLLDLIGSVTVVDSMAYVTASTDGVLAVDLEAQPDFAILGQWKTTRSINSVAIYDTLAFACGDDSLYILSIARSDSLYEVGSHPGISISAVVIDTLAYVCSFDDGIRILNISDPTLPVLVGSYDTPGRAMQLAIHNGIAYVADREQGLQIIDISEPTSPGYAGGYPTTRYARAVIERDTILFVADDGFGLLVLNVSDPAMPTLVGSLLIDQAPTSLAQDGVLLFGSRGVSPGKVYAMNVSDPSNPQLEATFVTPGSAASISAKDSKVYIADISALVILHYIPATSVVEPPISIPYDFDLLTNYPNPFNPSTTFRYWIDKPGHVTLTIYNVLGQRVATLIDAVHSAGLYELQWNAKDSRGNILPSGVYVGVLQASTVEYQRKMLLLR